MMIKTIKGFILKARSAFLHGKAFKKIEQGNYIGGAALLEYLCSDENNDYPEYSYFRLGDCYYRLHKYEKALNWLKRSFEIYHKNAYANKEERYLSCYNDVKNTYIKVLKHTGHHEYAKIVKSKN